MGVVPHILLVVEEVVQMMLREQKMIQGMVDLVVAVPVGVSVSPVVMRHLRLAEVVAAPARRGRMGALAAPVSC
jgi:hypothetical protein